MAAMHRARARLTLESELSWSLKDPFRNSNAAAQWIAALPTTDAMALQKEALDLVASFPGGRRILGPAQAEALLRVDARIEPVLAQLAQQYATNYQKSTDVETRLWHAVFDLVKAFAAAYGAVLRGGLSARRRTSAGRRCCRGCSFASSITAASTRSSGCSGTAPGCPRNGASSTSSTNSRGRAAGSGTSSPTAPGCSRDPASASSRST